MIVFDASALVGAALKSDSVPERALLRAEEIDILALSVDVDAEIAQVLSRPKFARDLSVPGAHQEYGDLVRAFAARRRLPRP